MRSPFRQAPPLRALRRSRTWASSRLENWRGDLTGGITTAVVALPLALAFGVASGAGAIAGLWGAIVLGLIAAPLGGTPSQVSGPTGPMTVIMAGIISLLGARYGSESGLAMAFTVALLAGGFQVVFGLLRLGQYITLMPYSVISGFMSGIGVIIVVLQLPALLGLSLRGSVPAILGALPGALGGMSGWALLFGLATFALVRLYPRRWNAWLPGPLAALVLLTLLSQLLPAEALPRLGTIPQGLPQLRWPQLDLNDLRLLGGFALTLGVLGSIDSLLTSLVADNITRSQHDSDRELIGQGIGNMAAALLGGLPGAGATMRTVTNVQAGGRTPLSGMVHSLVLLVLTVGAGGLARPIPLAVLAGILLHVGIEIIDWAFLARAPALSWRTTGLMWLVLLLTVFWDLVTAVVIGVFLANVLTIKGQAEALARSSQQVRGGGEGASYLDAREQELVERAGSDLLLLSFTGPLSFGSSRYLTQLLNNSSAYGTLVLDLSTVTHLGVTASLAIEALCRDAVQQERRILIAATDPQQVERLRRLGLGRNRAVQLVGSRREALERASGEQEVIPPTELSSPAPAPQEPPEGIAGGSRPSATAAQR
ncbi:sulfate permease [Cyanobium sp. PCC 7001]|uniref:SulP family inorganic anion transporter n=1 Tax=Cyanobium sp. PCC 7001 TaxID=180281 RepID=UPI00018053F2|nr:SulP family inorganic anion transporter [Cyanobium sp. PCC 7001]EDY37733.1 sulfate permease [Cyanobium sp. PCC 7001]